MKNNLQIKTLRYIYKLYLGASVISLVISICFLIRLYLFNLRAATIGDVFIILVLLLFMFYFRFNAFHIRTIIYKGEEHRN